MSVDTDLCVADWDRADRDDSRRFDAALANLEERPFDDQSGDHMIIGSDDNYRAWVCSDTWIEGDWR